MGAYSGAAPCSTPLGDNLCVLESPFGWILFEVGQGKLKWLSLGHGSLALALQSRELIAGRPSGTRREDTHLATLLRDRILAYLRGVPVTFEEIPLALDELTPFQAAVYRACQQVPYGSTWTYGRLASAIGRPRAARAVGRALARNPFPLVVPCHRVIGATGDLTGFTAPGGVSLKAKLIEFERRNAGRTG